MKFKEIQYTLVVTKKEKPILIKFLPVHVFKKNTHIEVIFPQSQL
jgi:hypothetical protein